MAEIPRLNSMTYLALSKKIESLKPKALQQLCNKLVSYGVIEAYDGNHFIYCILAYNKALDRLLETSSLSLLKKTRGVLESRLRKISLIANPKNNITDLKLIFKKAYEGIYWYLNNIEEVLIVNSLLEKQTGIIPQLNIRINLPALKNFSSESEYLINKHIIINNIGPEAAILKYVMPSYNPEYKSESFNEFKLDDLREIEKTIVQIMEENEGDSSTTN